MSYELAIDDEHRAKEIRRQAGRLHSAPAARERRSQAFRRRLKAIGDRIEADLRRQRLEELRPRQADTADPVVDPRDADAAVVRDAYRRAHIGRP